MGIREIREAFAKALPNGISCIGAGSAYVRIDDVEHQLLTFRCAGPNGYFIVSTLPFSPGDDPLLKAQELGANTKPPGE